MAVKVLRWQLYVTSLPERDVRNIRPLDFCSTDSTATFNIKGLNFAHITVAGKIILK